MKILFVTHCSTMAGANRSMLQLILELREDYGVEPIVVVPEYTEHENSIDCHLKKFGIPYKRARYGFFKSDVRVPHIFIEHGLSLKEALRISKELKSEGISIVHSNSSVIDFGAYLSSFLGVKHVWHFREYGDLDYSFFSIFGGVYERLIYKSPDAIIAISKSIKDYFFNKTSLDNIFVIYNGIKQNRDAQLSLHLDKKVQFVCAGVYCEGKNQKEILRAARYLTQELGITNFHITFAGIGDDTTYADEMRKYIRDNRLSCYITILGELNGISELVSKMDVGIVPSHAEAFGRVTVEYMMQNLAVIANDSGANCEIIVNGQSGLIYPSGDEHALADSMARLIFHRDELLQLGERGRERALSFFLSDRNTAKIYGLYKSLIGKKCKLGRLYYVAFSAIIVEACYTYIRFRNIIYTFRAKLKLRTRTYRLLRK